MKKNDLLFPFLMGTAMFFWGGSWVSAKVITNGVPSEVLVFWRFLITFLSYLPLALWEGPKAYRPRKEDWFWIILSAGALSLYNFLFFYALKVGASGKGGVMVTTLNPLFAFLIARLLGQGSFKKHQILGLVLGVLGGFLLIEPFKAGLKTAVLSEGNYLFILAALCWGFLTNFSSKAQRNLSVFTYSLLLYGLSSVIMFPLSWRMGVFDFSRMTPSFWINILFLGFIVGTFATTLYFRATQKLGPGRGASFTFLVPLFALLLSWAILGEVPSWSTLTGGALALAATAIINRSIK